MTHYTADAVIIGAGIVGCAIARAFSRDGLATVNVDPLPAPGYGSTSHSSAIIRPFYSHPVACALAHASRSRWLDWRDFLGHAGPDDLARYRECGGYVLVMEGQQDDYHPNLVALDAVGIPWEWLDVQALDRRVPGLSRGRFGPPVPATDPGFGEAVPGALAGAIYIPAAGYVNDPQLAARNLHAAAIRHGAQFRFRQAVTGVLRRADRACGVMLSTGEVIEAPVVINAAGPHSAMVNALAGIDGQMVIGTRPQRHEVAWLRKPATLADREIGFLADLDSGFYARSDGADLLIGTTDPACDVADVVDPDNCNAAFTNQWTLQVMRAAQRLEGLQIENRARGTVGIYDVSDDWIPVYDRSPLPGFFLAIGTSGNQFKNAPYIGELLLAIVRHELDGRDHDHNPAQLDLPEVGQRIDLGFYARNRPIGETRSVLA